MTVPIRKLIRGVAIACAIVTVVVLIIFGGSIFIAMFREYPTCAYYAARVEHAGRFTFDINKLLESKSFKSNYAEAAAASWSSDQVTVVIYFDAAHSGGDLVSICAKNEDLTAWALLAKDVERVMLGVDPQLRAYTQRNSKTFVCTGADCTRDETVPIDYPALISAAKNK